MTWTNRLRLWLSILLSLVLVFLLVVIFNQRQHTIQSSSATIIAPRVQVASNYGGIVVKQYVTVGQKVKMGDVLFDVSSVSLQQDLANRVKVASTDALSIDATRGVLTYKGAAVTLRLPDNTSITGVVDSALVATQQGQAVVTVRITSADLNARNLHLLATDGAPVSAVVRLRDEGVLAGPTDALRALFRKVGL